MTEHPELVFLTNIIEGIVTLPEKVKIKRQVDEMGVLFTIDVDPVDVSRVIGKDGNVAQAIRLLLKAAGYLHHVRASMKVNVPQKS